MATAVPAVLVGLFAGVVLDRVNRRTASVVSDVLSAAAIAALPLVDLLWGLNLGWFVLLGILGSFGDVPGLTAREVLVPAVARRSGMGLARLIGLREAVGSVGLLLGPAAAGTLMVLFEGATVLLITAATSAAAALLTLGLPHAIGRIEGGPVAAEPVHAQLTGGLRVLREHRLLLGVTVLSFGVSLVLGALQGLVLPVYFTAIERPDLLGFVLTALAVGLLGGAGAFAAFGPRLAQRAAVLIGLAGVTAGFALLGALAAPWLVFVGAFVLGLAGGLLGGVLGVVFAERTPDRARGRVYSVDNAATMIAAPAGIGLAAVIAEYVGVVAAGLALTGLWTALVVALLAGRMLADLGVSSRAQP